MVANRGQALSPPENGQQASVESEESASAADLPATASPVTTILPPLDGITARDPKLAAYIAQMALELSSMARAANFDLLAYFLDMARIEANIQAGKDN